LHRSSKFLLLAVLLFLLNSRPLFQARPQQEALLLHKKAHHLML
jgi:hypothetical protein